MNIILLSGGSGTRLWPLSNGIRAKQFLQIIRKEDGTKENMVQRMYRMIKEIDKNSRILFAASSEQESQIRAFLSDTIDISIETTRRDTFPAIVLACAYLKKMGMKNDEPIVVCPIDSYVNKDYFEKLKYLSSKIGEANLTLLGIRPTYPSGKYGYVLPNGKFIEKPSEEVAKQLIEKGALWNAGVFGFTLGYVLEKAKSHLDNIDYDYIYKNYEKLEKTSFDYAIAEKETSIQVIEFDGEWKDIGTWDSLTEVMGNDTDGNVIINNCVNTYVVNELTTPLVVLGIENSIVAATADGILVANKNESGKLKNYVATNRQMTGQQQWNEYTVGSDITIGIIGLGHVGLTLGICAASKGIKTFGIETNAHIKDCLKHNKAHFYEPGLDKLIESLNGKAFFPVEKFEPDVKYDAFIVTVGTPLRQGDTVPNFDYIKSALQSIEEIYDGTQLIILRSTVSVGTTRKVVLPFLASLCGRNKNELLVSMCPERTIEGKAIDELTHLPQIISGNNETAIQKAYDLFSKISPCIVKADSLEEAELCKLYCNTYRDLTFAIGNAFCMAAQEFGVDGARAIEHANYNYPRCNIAKPGFVAGPCLEKDAYILINNMPECDSKNLILAGRKYNESLMDLVVDFVKKKFGEPSNDKAITLSGMAFKGIPETSDLRGSTSVYIAKKLFALGYKLTLHDFVAHQSELESLKLGTYSNDLYSACEKSKLLLVLNNHPKYSQVEIAPCFTKEGFEILDAWGVCTRLHCSNEIKIHTLGNMYL